MEKEETRNENNQSTQTEPKNRFLLWIKRLGVAGFLFFLAKGLLWLALPTLLVWFAAK